MELVLLRNEEITTTSMIVAEVFDKRHDNVLQAIKELDCPDEFRALNFKGSYYPTKQNKRMPMYFITRDGFFLLAMGFTGPTASKFKIEFINQFNKLTELLAKKNKPSLLQTYDIRIMSQPAVHCPDNMWNVFENSHEIMLTIQKEIGSVNQYDLVDGSIGIHWSKYREGKKWAVMHTTYNHQFDDKRGTKQCKCYQYSELEHFKVWLKNKYKKEHLINYLKEKFKGDKVMYPKVLAFIPKLLPAKTA